jgi:hypothetical protein
MRFFFLLTLISISINCFSQRANHIVFGGGNVLTTTTSNPEISGAIFFSNFHTTSISDSSGNLLFYSNGSSTYGKDINMNFDRYAGVIHPGASQDLPCLLIPKPGNDTLYYLFTIENDLSGVLKSHLYLSELNAASGFGQGGFTKNINRSIQTNVNGLLAATQHCNGINTWILVHETNTNRFFAYLVTEDGISFTPVISEIGPSNAMYNGTMVFSPNGKLLAVGHTTEYLADEQYQNIIQLYDFDNATGKISNQRVYSKLNTPTCPTFSNNSQFLYTVALDENPDVYDPTHLFQFDLRNNDYQLANPQIVYSFKTYPNTNAGGESPTAQLASNGKIYCFDILYGKYYEVQNPNIAGPACTVKEVYKDMPNGSLKVFFNVISNYLDSSYTEKKAKIFIENICYGNPTKFKVNSSIAFDAINWTFENRSSKYKIESNSISPAINFSEGEYIANAIIKGNCTTDTIKAYFAIKKQIFDVTVRHFPLFQ